MEDKYRIHIELDNNSSDCFSRYTGSDANIDAWEDDFVEAIYKELNDIRIKYKDFTFDIDTGAKAIVFIRIENEKFTDWENDAQWYKFIEESNREKENMLNVINTEIIDKLNDVCKNLKLCKFPDDDFMYNSYDKSFYVSFNSGYQPDVIQLKFDYVDDIDFEEF